MDQQAELDQLLGCAAEVILRLRLAGRGTYELRNFELLRTERGASAVNAEIVRIVRAPLKVRRRHRVGDAFCFDLEEVSEPDTRTVWYRNAEKTRYRTVIRRILASFVDGVALLPLSQVHALLWASKADLAPQLLVLGYLFSSLIPFFYSILLHGYFGQTVGKMACGVKVLDVSGKKLGFSQAILRDAVPLLLIALALPLELRDIRSGILPADHVLLMLLTLASAQWALLEVLTMLLNRKRRALHDFIAGSVVVRTDSLEASSKLHAIGTRPPGALTGSER